MNESFLVIGIFVGLGLSLITFTMLISVKNYYDRREKRLLDRVAKLLNGGKIK